MLGGVGGLVPSESDRVEYVSGAPLIYTSRNALLYSLNLNSPKKPMVPMAKLKTGGTLSAWLNKLLALSSVPSPPSVQTKSVLSERSCGAP